MWPISERRSWVILRIDASSIPISPGARPSQVEVRSPAATRSAIRAAWRIGRVIDREIDQAAKITVATVAGKIYQLETSALLTTGSWSPVGDPVNATGPSTTLTHTNGAGDTKRFYRARVVP